MNRPDRNEVHLWWAYPDRILDPDILERQLLVLSEWERQKQRQFVFERHRHQYLISHALVRDALSRHAPVPPAEWRFAVNAYGRPSIAEPADWRGLCFNLSHTEGRAVVAVAWEIDIGVDVEATTRHGELTQIADRFFSRLEVAQLESMPDRFFDFWTLKEAYIKARGMGLSIPLGTFSFILSSGEEPQILFHEGCCDQPERWKFKLGRGDGYRFGLAAGTGPGQPLRVFEREIVPLVAE